MRVFTKASSIVSFVGVLALGFVLFGAQPAHAATAPDACFTFDDSTGTITSYEAPGGANNCPSDLDLPSSIDVAGVPTPVTAIGNQAFSNKSLTAVTFPTPNTITSVGEGAFKENQLTTVDIPSSITTWGGQGIFGYNQLTSLTLHEGMTTIPMSMFAGNKLTSVTIPKTVTTIEGQAFAGNQLTSVSLPNSVVEVQYMAFAYNHISSLSLGNSLKTIQSRAFVNNHIHSVVLPASLDWGGGDPTPALMSSFMFQMSSNYEDVASVSTLLYKDMYNSWYVQFYTQDPANQVGYKDIALAANEAQLDADVNGNGTKDDIIVLAGGLINPTPLTINYQDTNGAMLQPSQTIVGQNADGSYMTDYLLKNGPVVAASANGDPFDITPAEQQAMRQALLIYYHKGTAQTFTAPSIAGYTLQSPASPHTMTLASATNNLTWVYAADTAATPTASPNAPDSGVKSSAGLLAAAMAIGLVFAGLVVTATRTLRRR